MSENETTLTLYPVCECEQVIKELVINNDEYLYQAEKMKEEFRIPHIQFFPHKCPRCYKIIVGMRTLSIMECQGKIDFSEL